MIAEAVKEKVGIAKWNSFPESARARMLRIHKIDCWHHMRAFTVAAMAAAGNKLLENALRLDLDSFHSWERIEVKGSSLVWHHRDADPEFGALQAKELQARGTLMTI